MHRALPKLMAVQKGEHLFSVSPHGTTGYISTYKGDKVIRAPFGSMVRNGTCADSDTTGFYYRLEFLHNLLELGA